MAIDEYSRHRLHARLEDLPGEDEAATLMEYLPPVGWGDVATKRDLAQLEDAIRRDHEHLEVRIISKMNERFVEMQRHFILAVILAMMASTLSVGGLAFAAAKLF